MDWDKPGNEAQLGKDGMLGQEGDAVLSEGRYMANVVDGKVNLYGRSARVRTNLPALSVSEKQLREG